MFTGGMSENKLFWNPAVSTANTYPFPCFVKVVTDNNKVKDVVIE